MCSSYIHMYIGTLYTRVYCTTTLKTHCGQIGVYTYRVIIVQRTYMYIIHAYYVYYNNISTIIITIMVSILCVCVCGIS